jgi:hypothetical protein
MNMKLHKMLAASVKLFLDELGYKSVWNQIDDNFVELVVFPPVNKLLKAVDKEIQKTGFIPYQFSMTFNPLGKVVEGVQLEKTKKIEFDGEVKEHRTFENISGDFHLIRYEDTEGNNYLNKRYKLDKEIVQGPVHVIARPVAVLSGLNGEVVNLINWARVK